MIEDIIQSKYTYEGCKNKDVADITTFDFDKGDTGIYSFKNEGRTSYLVVDHELHKSSIITESSSCIIPLDTLNQMVRTSVQAINTSMNAHEDDKQMVSRLRKLLTIQLTTSKINLNAIGSIISITLAKS